MSEHLFLNQRVTQLDQLATMNLKCLTLAAINLLRLFCLPNAGTITFYDVNGNTGNLETILFVTSELNKIIARWPAKAVYRLSYSQ